MMSACVGDLVIEVHGTLYTICLDFNGGTYLSQFRSSSVVSAVNDWAEMTPDAHLQTWGATRDDLKMLAKSDVVPVDGLTSVHCLSQTIHDQLMLLHVVGTLG